MVCNFLKKKNGETEREREREREREGERVYTKRQKGDDVGFISSQNE